MIKLQRITGMRPGEVVRMRPCDIRPSEDPHVAIYEPAEHKTNGADIENWLLSAPKPRRSSNRS